MCLAYQLKSTNVPLVHKARLSKHDGHHIIVQHNYKDHAKDTPPVLDNILETLVNATSANASFPFKLYDMLQRVEQDGNAHIVSFQPHGRCMVIHKPDLMVDLLPRYFNLSKLSSLQRQLNLYGFRRLTKGPDRGGYYHELFLRGKPFLMPRIQRMKVKGTGVRARSNPDQEPDFWSMPWVGVEMTDKQTMPCMTKSAMVVQSSASIVSADEHDSDMDEDDHEEEFEPLSLDIASQFDDDLEPLPVASQSFEFAQPLEYKDDMELSAWGMTFHYMEDISVDADKASAEEMQSSQTLMSVFDDVDSCIADLVV